jgi:hypothetical protein
VMVMWSRDIEIWIQILGDAGMLWVCLSKYSTARLSVG